MPALPMSATMLIVDPSDFGGRCEKIFEPQYRVVRARSMEEALDYLQSGPGFDIVITEVILPTYRTNQGTSATKDTGLRLLERMIASGACRRFLVATSRGDLDGQIAALPRGGTIVRALKKQSVADAEIRAAVVALAEARPAGSVYVPAALQTVADSYAHMFAALAEVYATLIFHCPDFEDPDLKRAIRAAREELEKAIARHRLFARAERETSSELLPLAPERT